MNVLLSKNCLSFLMFQDCLFAKFFECKLSFSFFVLYQIYYSVSTISQFLQKLKAILRKLLLLKDWSSLGILGITTYLRVNAFGRVSLVRAVRITDNSWKRHVLALFTALILLTIGWLWFHNAFSSVPFYVWLSFVFSLFILFLSFTGRIQNIRFLNF